MKWRWSSRSTWGTIVIYSDGWMRIHVCFGIYCYLTTNLFFTWLVMVWLSLANLSFHFIWNRLRAYTYTIIWSNVIFIHDLFSDYQCLFLVVWALNVSILYLRLFLSHMATYHLIIFPMFVWNYTCNKCATAHTAEIFNLLFYGYYKWKVTSSFSL